MWGLSALGFEPPAPLVDALQQVLAGPPVPPESRGGRRSPGLDVLSDASEELFFDSDEAQ